MVLRVDGDGIILLGVCWFVLIIVVMVAIGGIV